MLKLICILPCLLIMFQPLNAKVEPLNYDFSIKTLEEFYPGKTMSELESKYGKAEALSTQSGMKSVRFKVSQIRYKFTVLVQEKDGIINDFFARLPTYFLHDIFLQSLVNKLGKQTTFKKVGEEAYYIWNAGGQKHVYSAACTITCFPIFYSVEPLESKVDSTLQQMTKASQGK